MSGIFMFGIFYAILGFLHLGLFHSGKVCGTISNTKSKPIKAIIPMKICSNLKVLLIDSCE